MTDINRHDPVLSVKDLVVKFNLRGQVLTAIRGISLDLFKGESLAVVGESGSGKSVFCKTFMGLLDNNGWIDHGSIMYDGQDLARFKKEKEWTKVRGSKIAMVFQDPMTSLNPLKSIGKQIQEAFTLHNRVSDSEAKARTLELLTDVGIPEPERRYKQYPHEFSGGMRQRVVIAIAMACVPEILICDEPTTALDVTIQAQILDLLKKLQAKYGLTIIYITHDLGVVANVADRIAVMYAGDIIEIGTCEEVFYDPRHPYTWALLSSLPQLGVKGQDLYSITGTPPNLFQKITGDAFAMRNPDALKIDFVARPPYFQITPTHKARTWLLDERVKNAELPEHVRNLYDPEKRNANHNVKEREFREVLVSVRDMEVTFGSGRNKFVAVKGVSFDIFKGETFGLVGESGSGKTTIGRGIIRINPLSGGEVFFKGQRISGKISKELDKSVTQNIQMIFQDPMASLNERAKVDYIVSEGLMNVKRDTPPAKRKELVDQALLEVGLLPEFSSRFPHEFSGGQRQRIGIARSLIMEPEFIIADEPISALDVSIRAQVLNLMSKLQKEYGLTYLFIAHDLSVMRFICDRIAVIQKGVIVELASTEKLFANPLHPYTRALLSAVPMPDPKLEKNKVLEIFDPGSIENDRAKLIWSEIEPGHFILGSETELAVYSERLRQNR